MSINDFEEDITSTSSQRTNTTSNTSQQNKDSFSGKGNTGNALTTLQNIQGVSASSNRASGTTTEVIETLKKVKERTINMPNQLPISIVAIEHPRLKIAAVALVSKFSQSVSYSILLLEAYGKPLANRTEVLYAGKVIENDLTTAHYFDSDMRAIVEETIKVSDTSFHNLDIVNRHMAVIPREVDLKNEDTLAVFYDQAYGAILCNARVLSGAATSEITAALLTDPTLQLVASYDITPGATNLDANRAPMANDFTITLQARPANKKITEQSLHGNAEDVTLASIAGYVDVMRVSNAQPKVMGYGQHPVMPGYAPVFVIVNNSIINSNGARGNDTLLSQLLGLAILAPLLDNKKWVSIFEPVIGDGSKKPSLGVLGLEHSPYLGMPLKPEIVQIAPGHESGLLNSDKVTASDFVQRYFTDDIIIAHDVIYGSPLQWLQSIYENATPGTQAEDIIVRELDAFSNGLFSKIWKPKQQPVMAADKTILHAGYVTNNHSQISDIRSINYLAMLEHTNGDQNLFVPFSKGFLPGSASKIDIDEKRKHMLTVAPNATITGVITRSFFNNEFLRSINEMLDGLKLVINPEGLNETATGFAQFNGLNGQFFKAYGAAAAFHTQARPGNNGGNLNIGGFGSIANNRGY